MNGELRSALACYVGQGCHHPNVQLGLDDLLLRQCTRLSGQCYWQQALNSYHVDLCIRFECLHDIAAGFLQSKWSKQVGQKWRCLSLIYLQESHITTSTIFYWLCRPTLIHWWWGLHRGLNIRLQGSLVPSSRLATALGDIDLKIISI